MFSCGSPWLCVSLLWNGLILTATAQAQIPVGVIQTGSLTVSSTSSRPVFTVSSVLGRIVDIHSVFDDGAFEMEFCRPCVAGAQVGIGGRITSVGRGNQFYEVDFTLAGTPLEIPVSGLADLVLTAPFKFEGRLIASPRRHAGEHEKERAVTFEGVGTVTVRFSSSINPESGERLYFFQDAAYRFSRPGR